MELPLALAAAAVAAALWRWVVPRVRVADPNAPDFAESVSGRTTALVALLALGGAAVLWQVPAHHWWLWWPYLAFGAPLILLDALTTYLPKRLHYLALAAMALGSIPLAVAHRQAWGWATLGAAAAFGFFYLAYRVSPTLGFGDVRLAVLVGAVAGMAGITATLGAVLLGTLMGAVHGIGHALWARRGTNRPAHFAYGPSLWAGPILAALLSLA